MKPKRKYATQEEILKFITETFMKDSYKLMNNDEMLCMCTGRDIKYKFSERDQYDLCYDKFIKDNNLSTSYNEFYGEVFSKEEVIKYYRNNILEDLVG